jgi:hypothetical protein
VKKKYNQGRKLAKQLIKDGIIGKYTYILSSSFVVDGFTRGFCEILDDKEIKYNIGCLWMIEERIESINETIYPAIRKYIEPVKRKLKNILCFNIPKEVSDYAINDYINQKEIKVLRFCNDQFIDRDIKTPNLVKERRSNYL